VKIGDVISGVGEILGIVIRDYPASSGFGDPSPSLENPSTRDTPVNYEL
jgi:hypothetical protein